MQLATLPWFIRKEIFEFVIEDHKEYRLLSKEWFALVVSRYGKIEYTKNDCCHRTKLSQLMAPHIETVVFSRSTSIDWNYLVQKSNVKQVKLFRVYPVITEFPEKFMEFTLKLTALRSLTMALCGELELCTSSILGRHSSTLIELSLDVKLHNWNTRFKDLTFPSLVKLGLEIRSKGDLDTLQSILNLSPKLIGLRLGFSEPGFILSLPNKAAGITELDFMYDQLYYCPKLKVDLNSFPNLEKIITSDLIEYIDQESSNTVKRLNLTVIYNHQIHEIIQVFAQLDSLSTNIGIFSSSGFMKEVFNFYTKLTTLELISSNGKFPKKLLYKSYTVTDLTLKGFYITPHLLRWLSACFRLTSLRIEDYILQSGDRLKPVPFPYLDRLVINRGRLSLDDKGSSFEIIYHPHVDLVLAIDCNRPTDQTGTAQLVNLPNSIYLDGIPKHKLKQFVSRVNEHKGIRYKRT